MKLYAVEYCGPLSNNEQSIVTIHTSRTFAEAAIEQYLKSWEENDVPDCRYTIKVIDTDKEIYDGCVYSYD